MYIFPFSYLSKKQTGQFAIVFSLIQCTYSESVRIVYFSGKTYIFPTWISFPHSAKVVGYSKILFPLFIHWPFAPPAGTKQEEQRRGSTSRSIFQIVMAGILITIFKPIISSMIDIPDTHKTKGFQQPFF